MDLEEEEHEVETIDCRVPSGTGSVQCTIPLTKVTDCWLGADPRHGSIFLFSYSAQR